VTEPSQDKEWEKMAERSRDAYRLARELLEQGMSTTDVARQVGLGIAEVNVLKRMRDAAR
jgi:Trp operon repressor